MRQKVLVKQKLFHADILDSIFIPPGFHIVLDNYDFSERVRDSDQGLDFLLFLFRVVDGKRRLNIKAIIAAINHKIDFQLFSGILSVFVL